MMSRSSSSLIDLAARVIASVGLIAVPWAAWRTNAAPTGVTTRLFASGDGMGFEQSLGPHGPMRSATFGAKSLLTIGGRPVGQAWLLDPRVVVPSDGVAAMERAICIAEFATAASDVRIQTRLDGRSHAVAGRVAEIVSTRAGGQVVAARPSDAPLARAIVEWSDRLDAFVKEMAPELAGAAAQRFLIALCGADDRGNAESGPHLFADLIVGPLAPGCSLIGYHLAGRLVLDHLASRGAPVDDPLVLAFVAAAADLLQEALGGGRALFAGDLAEERASDRVALLSDRDRYSRREALSDPARQLWAVELLAPNARRRLLAEFGGAEQRPDANLARRLLQVVVAGIPDSALSDWCDPEQAQLAATASLQANSVVEPALPPPSAPIVTIEVAVDHNGYLESCGCKSTQGGGFIDLYQFWRAEERPPAARVLLGGVLGAPGSTGYSPEANTLILRTANELRIDAWVPGPRELALIADGELRGGAFGEVPLIACNVAPKGPLAEQAPPFRKFVDLDTTGAPCRLIGVSRLSARYCSPRREAWVGANFEFSDPVLAVLREVAATPANRAVIVAGAIEPRIGAAIAAASKRPLLFCSTDGMLPRFAGDQMVEQQVDGSVGGQPLLFGPTGPYWVERMEWAPGEGARSIAVKLLDAPGDEGAREEFRGLVQELLERSAGPVELAFDDPLLVDGNRYVGTETCAGCHRVEHADWLETPHARAWRTLERVQRQRVRNCVACHVVGFGQASGYDFANPDPELRDVGCEVCHGPGGHHADRSGDPGAILRAPPLDRCAACHTVDHSDMLLGDPSRFRARIDHDPATKAE